MNDTVLEVCESCGGDGGFDDTYIGRDHEVHSDWHDCNRCERTGLMLIEAEPIEMADIVDINAATQLTENPLGRDP